MEIPALIINKSDRQGKSFSMRVTLKLVICPQQIAGRDSRSVCLWPCLRMLQDGDMPVAKFIVGLN